MQYTYMIDRAAAKAEARQLIRNYRGPVLSTGTLYFLIALFLTLIELWSAKLAGDASTVFLFVSVISSLISTVLSAGFVLLCMALRRGEQPFISMLFDGFGMAGKVILLSIVMSLRVFLWSLLFLIPGLVAMYRYRFALFNLLENPELTVGQAIALSKIQTQGMKGQLFMLDLSFIGWTLLAFFTLGFLMMWLTPYTWLTELYYYQEGKKIISPFPHGIEPEDTEQG